MLRIENKKKLKTDNSLKIDNNLLLYWKYNSKHKNNISITFEQKNTKYFKEVTAIKMNKQWMKWVLVEGKSQWRWVFADWREVPIKMSPCRREIPMKMSPCRRVTLENEPH